MTKSAKLSECRKYRFALWRNWDSTKPTVMFVCLNPSTADENIDDSTIRRCINFAKSWGYGGLCMVNLFAFRATEPEDLKEALDPIGPGNDEWLIQQAKHSDKIVAGWGNHGSFMERSKAVVKLFPKLYCLKINDTGEPAHPLFLKADLKPFLFQRNKYASLQDEPGS